MIRLVMLFKNGFCAVFNDKGEQVVELQGQWRKKYKAVFKAVSYETRWEDYR